MKKSLLFITFLILAFIGKTFGYCQQEVTPAFAMYNIEDANPINHRTEYLYLYFNTELRPSDYIIVKQLKNHYPDTKLDWDSALTRKNHGLWEIAIIIIIIFH